MPNGPSAESPDPSLAQHVATRKPHKCILM
jgi:hypothetical protein